MHLAVLPPGLRWRQLAGAAALGGIGFTVSLFIAGLSFDGAQLDEAKLGILTASLVSGLLGSVVLLTRAQSSRRADAIPSSAALRE